MRWLLSCFWLLSLSCAVHSQTTPTPSGVATSSTAAAAAFELVIDAPDELRSLLQTHLALQRYRELTDLSDSELERLIAAAQQDSRALVATLGYFSPEIEVTLLPTNPSGQRTVKIQLAPGQATLVSDVQIRFNGAIADDPLPLNQRQQIEDAWGLRTGMHFTQAAWDGAKQQALRQLSSRRFPTGQISSSLADIDPQQHSARLAITLDSGPAYRLGPWVISGLQQQDAELVKRLARLPEGGDYDQTQLVQAQQRLADSGYFDSAFLSLDTTGDPAAAPLLAQLREGKLQKLVLGLGASTDSGARLSVEHTHFKLPGIGWRGVSKLSLDRSTQALSTALTAPPDASQWRWATSGLLQSQHSGNIDVASQRLRLGRSQDGDHIERNLYLQYDRAITDNNDGNVAETAQSLSANYSFTLRNFDQLPFPSSGWGWGAELGGGMTLGSQQNPYARLVSRWLSYHPLGSREAGAPNPRTGRLAFRAELGAVLAKDETTLPSTQLFLTGGDSSVRGYGVREIGLPTGDGQINAGRYLAVASLEWQRPISVNGQLTEWESTLFLDAGAVADRASDLQAKVGIGAGVRWKSPVGPLQIDLAYGLAVKSLRLHMNVGFSF